MTETRNSPAQRAQWSSEPAFVFSMAAAAVGLGNLWRFPYMVGENGGAAFVLAYLIALAFLAVPLMMLEVGAGRLAKGSAVATFRVAHPRFGAFYGWCVILLTIAISSYYLVVTGWTLGYALQAVTFSLVPFAEFTQGYASLWYFLAVTALAVAVLIRGVSAIETLSKLLMPVLLVLVIGLVALASRTDGWDQARAFLLQADFSRLADSRLWLFAVGQAFYTLAIGQGYLVTYGSYIPRRTHVPRACLIVALTETSVALLAGWMIFPYVFSFGQAPDEGSQLAFTTLPRVFAGLQGGPWLAMAFFGLFFAAAFSSCLAGLKVIVAAFEEEFRLTPTRAVLATGALMVALGTPSALSYSPLSLSVGDTPFLDFVDQLGGTTVVIASGVIGAGLYCWRVPRARIHDSLAATSRAWETFIVLLGRSLPFLGLAFLFWRLLG